jgi:hypothetical protein
MSQQTLTGTGQIYDDDELITEVAYQLPSGEQTTGLLTFQDILVRDRVAERMEDKQLFLETSDGQRRAILLSDISEGNSPSLPVRFA